MLLKYFYLGFLVTAFSANLLAKDIQFTAEEIAWIKSHPEIEHGYEPNWAPYGLYENGEYVGIVADYLDIVEKETGINFVAGPQVVWGETIRKLKSGELKMVPCAGISDLRKEYLYFTAPYITVPLVIVTAKDAKHFIGEMEGLNQMKLAIPQNYYTRDMIAKDYPEIELVYFPGILECLQAVTDGKTDAFVGNLEVISYYMNKKGFSNLKIVAPTSYEPVKFAFAVTKDYKLLRDIIEKVLQHIPHQTHNEIRDKWISVRYENGINMEKVKRYSFYAGLVVLLLFTVVLLWTKSLKMEIRKRMAIEKELASALATVKKKSEERKVLLQEIHHRVKNNLQIIISLLRLQNNADDLLLESKLKETITRINAISLVHEKVYLSDNLANINLKKYVESLAEEVITSFAFENRPVLKVESNIVDVNLKPLIPVALILNELITNSLKYGLKGLENGMITIRIERENGKGTKMVYCDNGSWIAPKASAKSFGLSLIDVFSEQLEGGYERTVNEGTRYTFLFGEIL